jgi:hypothetical protein
MVFLLLLHHHYITMIFVSLFLPAGGVEIVIQIVLLVCKYCVILYCARADRNSEMSCFFSNRNTESVMILLCSSIILCYYYMYISTNNVQTDTNCMYYYADSKLSPRENFPRRGKLYQTFPTGEYCLSVGKLSPIW